MQILSLDFETYYDNDYTLSKMTTEEYIRDERFEPILLGVRYPNGNLAYFPKPDIKSFCEQVAWDKVAVLAHHAHFDGLILSHHYGVKPGHWLDTLSMARMVVGNHLSVSLASLAKHYDLAAKNVPYDLFKGKHFNEISAPILRMLGDGCLHDCELTYDIFGRLAKQFPKEEYQLVDTTIRMFTEPWLEGDIPLLGKIWMEENKKKKDALAELGVTSEQLNSAEQFAELLRAEGIEPQTKQGKNGPIYAFAKSDQFMRDLEDDPDDRVSALVSARLGNKSTLIQSRTERLGGMASRGKLPVYLTYCGAHTTRWSGGDKSNWQNYRRGHIIRKTIVAPKGYTAIVADASQIECRLLNTFAGQWDVVDRFRNKEDPYINIASQFYGRPITKADPAERGTGKQLELSCGYGAGTDTIILTAKKGTYGPPVYLTYEQGEAAKTLYRQTHTAVTALWGTAGRLIARIAGGSPLEWQNGVVIKDKRLYGPNGAWINYETLIYDTELASWKFKKRAGWKTIWGGFLVENLIQFLARIHLGQCMNKLKKDGIPKIALCTHDDIVALVRDDNDASKWLDYIIAVMSRSPSWMPDVPLDAEGAIGHTYGDAK